MTLPSGTEKRVNVTLLLNEDDLRTAAHIVANKQYRVLALRQVSRTQVEVRAFFGALDIFDAFDRLEDDDMYPMVTSVELQGYLSVKKAGV